MSWDAAKLTTKYPWLRADSEALEDFRAPFASSSSSSSASSSDADSERKDSNSVTRRPGVRKKPKHTRRRVKKASIANRNQDATKELRQEPLKLPPATRDLHGFIQERSSTDPDLVTDGVIRGTHTETRMPLRKRKKKAKKNRLLALTLQLPALSAKKTSTSSASKTAANRETIWVRDYSEELDVLHQAEEQLKNDVEARIEAERARLPLTFLFQRNLGLRSYCKEKGVATITQIFAKLQHRLLFSAFEHWQAVNEIARREERKLTIFKQSQERAIKLFVRLASDAYIGTIDRALQKWHLVAQSLKMAERNCAAALIQTRFRKRRALALAIVLKQASLDADYKRSMEIHQLLRFESYGTTMLWSSLRLGFNLVLQNHCARRIQFFFRRIAVQQRINIRVIKRVAATKIQTQWRMHIARADLANRKDAAARRRAEENRAATRIQCYARSRAARNQLNQLRLHQERKQKCTTTLQKWWRKCHSRRVLFNRFVVRRQIICEQREQLERIRLQEEKQQQRQDAAIHIQRVARGRFARRVYRDMLHSKNLDRAARRVQAGWRKSKGRYALHLRFAAQGQRLEQMRTEAAQTIQSCFRIHVAKSERRRLQNERNRRRLAVVVIQRNVRQYFAKKRYRQQRRSAITIQTGIRGKLARLLRQRIYRESEQKRLAITRIQCWARSVCAQIIVKRLREKKLLAIERRRQSALVIQKRARGVEVRKMVSLLREAIKLVELEQSRHCPGSVQQNSSELLDFVTKHYFSNPSDVGSKRFTVLEYDWLQQQLELSKEQIRKEDLAIVFLQRYYRGYVCRAAFWAMKVRDQQRRAREKGAVIVIQRVGRGFLARRRVRRRRQQRTLEELKTKYIQERRRKEQEQQWQEQYQREQLEIQIRKAKQLEMKLIHAKREAELAKYQAEAAIYREQELKAQKEFEKQQKHGSKRGDYITSPWEIIQDEFGNAYYYNSITNESRWDPPPQEDLVDSSDMQDEDKKVAKQYKSEDTTIPLSFDTKQESTRSPRTAQLTDGKCGICKSSRATKQCIECSGFPFFCTSCFTQEHHGPLASTSKSAHDFKVVTKIDTRSRCQSKLETKPPSDANFATYFCYECSAFPNRYREAADQTTKLGCFYCDECFQHAHVTVQELQHVANAMHFKSGAHLCSECTNVVAVRMCEQCDERFCVPCFDSLHGSSRTKSDHTFTAIEILKEELSSDKDSYCEECDVRRSVRLCNLCGDGFCEQCFEATHAKGAKQNHTWIPWSSFAQVGDWLEIFDEKANTKIFFNLETKESTTKQPFVLKGGTERHQLQLAEREQQHKKRELELESELVKVKEQLRAMEEKEAKAAQRPMSRNLTSESGPRVNAPAQEEVLKANETKKFVKKNKKQGLLRRLFASGKPDVEEEGLTEDEKKRKQLAEGVQAAERQLILEKLRTRTREEKESKARGTVGTSLFEQAMVKELAQSK